MSETSDLTNVVPFKKRRRALSNRGALQFLREAGGDDGVVKVASYADLGAVLGWTKDHAYKACQRWTRDKRVEIAVDDNGGLVSVRALPDRDRLARGQGSGMSADRQRRGRRGQKHVPATDANADNTVDIVANTDSKSNTWQNSPEPGNVLRGMPAEAAADAFPKAAETAPSSPLPRGENRTVVHDGEHLIWRHGGGGGGHSGALAVNRHAGVDVAALGAAAALAVIAAYFSVHGMAVLFPGTHNPIMVMAVAMEAAKIITAAWLSARWAEVAWSFRLLLVAFTFGVASINAVGVYSQLVAAHVGPRGVAAAGLETRDADAAARIEVVQSRIADLDRRLAQIDGAVEAATKRGRTNGAMSVMQDQRRARAALASEREQAARALADIKTERTATAARGRAAEAEAAPVMYVAQLFGIERDAEQIIRWLIAAMVCCCDPLSLALVAAVSARRSRRWQGGAA